MVSGSGEASPRRGGIARCSNRPNLKSRRVKSTHSGKNRSYTTSSTTYGAPKTVDLAFSVTRFTVDIADLLFTPERDFLVKKTAKRVDDLKGKAIVLFMVPLYESYLRSEDNLDMVQAYNELLPLGGVEFMLVPVYLDFLTSIYNKNKTAASASQEAEAIFDGLFSTMPFPAVPFSDIESCGGRVVKTFSLDHLTTSCFSLPYWVIIDQTGTVVTQRWVFTSLFKLYGGAELHPLSSERIGALGAEHYSGVLSENGCEARKLLISNWDQLLASPTRDYLISSNGDHVPISSLQGKVIGLFFCDNVPLPLHMGLVKKVYEEAKLRGYDFEIVQINFHYHFFNSSAYRTQDMSVQQCNENVSWLTLPFKDPCCKKSQRIFRCQEDDHWQGSCLVIVDPRQADVSGVLFEFCGVEIFQQYRIEGYPFTRQCLYEMEYRRQINELRLQSLFPAEQCHLIRPNHAGEVFDGSQLAGKKVVVLFGEPSELESCAFVSILKSKYRQQVHNEFEVVYVPSVSHFNNESIKDMPWLVVHSYSAYFREWCCCKIFKRFGEVGAAAFGTDGQLIAKEPAFDESWEEKDDSFPFFVSQDLETQIRNEVESVCALDRYHFDDDE